MIPVSVRCVDPSDLSALGIKFVKPTWVRHEYVVDDDTGQLWKHGCCIKMYDDGEITVYPNPHAASKRELRVIYGLAEKVFQKGPRLPKAEGWERRRKTKKRPRPFWITHYYVNAKPDDDAYAATITEVCTLTAEDRAAELRATQQLDELVT
ncbi:hypothetical protein SEA_ODAY_21 [Gordonia phage ODay]|nr:hypothetical protein SEA_ODAY_21 [Gordonia phage ODay]